MQPVVDALLRRRVVFVAGKGGTGKSTVAAALALIAARAGKRVLAVDVDAKGDLAAALGSGSTGFAPQVVQRGISTIALQAEESFQEYLRLYFKVPRVARLTPLSRVFDFIATGVPGPRDMLVVGKIAYEERRREPGGQPRWDLIVVDSAASGHVVSHLAAARAMLSLVRSGVIRGQVEWIDELVRDDRRCTVLLCALPEEMPVREAIEVHDRLRAEAGVSVSGCVLNRMVTVAVSPSQRRLVTLMCAADGDGLRTRLGGNPEPLADSLELARRLHDTSVDYARQLRKGLPVPLLPVPLETAARSGLAMARAVADALAGGRE